LLSKREEENEMNSYQLAQQVEANLPTMGLSHLKTGVSAGNTFWVEVREADSKWKVKAQLQFDLPVKDSYDFGDMGTILHRIKKFAELMGEEG
jgi:hypothetical protein